MRIIPTRALPTESNMRAKSSIGTNFQLIESRTTKSFQACRAYGWLTGKLLRKLVTCNFTIIEKGSDSG